MDYIVLRLYVLHNLVFMSKLFLISSQNIRPTENTNDSELTSKDHTGNFFEFLKTIEYDKRSRPGESLTNGNEMSEEGCLAALTYQSAYASVLDKLESKDGASVQQLRSALTAVDMHNPMLLLDLTKAILIKSGLQVNLRESYLRMQALSPTDDLQLPHQDPVFQQLSNRAIALRQILARIPDEMGDRRTFLETIKEIASAIKKLLDATNRIILVVPPHAQPAVEKRKKEFVHFSKKFSNTLKEYFKGDDQSHVFLSANQLILQTTAIMRTVRERTPVTH